LFGKKIHEDNTKLSADNYSPYLLNVKGQLSNQFGSEFKGKYTKDFHQAMLHYINDMSFSKNISPILPYVYSIEYYNANKFGEKEAKKNVTEWLNHWKAKHIFKEDKVMFPEVDYAMKFMRQWTSLIAMTFNAKAGFWNAVVGKYNAWRESGLSLKGEKRMFKSGKDGKYFISKKAKNVLENYHVVATEQIADFNSNALGKVNKISRVFSMMGEYYVQGTQFLGQISNEDWAKINQQGEYTGADKEAFEERIRAYKKKVSDTQGKYSDKDRRNFELWELGRFIGQFKTWIPDWWRVRFGEKGIGANGEEMGGSYRYMFDKSISDLIKSISTRELFTSKEPYFVNMRKNLSELLLTAILLSFKFSGDDDDKKRKQGDALSQATQNLLFVFDPSTLSYTIGNPAAGLKPTKDFLKMLSDALSGEEYKTGKRKGELKATGEAKRLLPYNNLVNNEYVNPKED